MYHLAAGTFTNFLWIKGGDVFTNVDFIEVEMTNSGAFQLEVLSEQNSLLARARRENPNGGWHTFQFGAGEIQLPTGGRYKFRLVNDSPGTRVLHGGSVQP